MRSGTPKSWGGDGTTQSPPRPQNPPETHRGALGGGKGIFKPLSRKQDFGGGGGIQNHQEVTPKLHGDPPQKPIGASRRALRGGGGGSSNP